MAKIEVVKFLGTTADVGFLITNRDVLLGFPGGAARKGDSKIYIGCRY